MSDIRDIMVAVSKATDVPISDLIGEKRIRSVVVPRQMVMFIAAERTNLAYARIGKELGGRDHTTVLSGLRHFQWRLENSKKLQGTVQLVNAALNKFEAPPMFRSRRPQMMVATQ